MTLLVSLVPDLPSLILVGPDTFSLFYFVKRTHPRINSKAVCWPAECSPISASQYSDLSYHSHLLVFNLAATEVVAPAPSHFGPPFSLSWLDQVDKQWSFRWSHLHRGDFRHRSREVPSSREGWGKYLCDPPGQGREEEKGHMSLRSTAPDLSLSRLPQKSPSSPRSPQQADRQPTQDVIRTSSPTKLPAVTTSAAASEGVRVESAKAKEPSQARASISPSAGRSFGVQSILNPTYHEISGESQQEQDKWRLRGTSIPVTIPRVASTDVSDTKPSPYRQPGEGEGLSGESGELSQPTKPILNLRSPNTRTASLGSVQQRKTSTDSPSRPLAEDRQRPRDEGATQKSGETAPYVMFPSNTGSNRPPIFGSLPEPPSLAHNRRTSGGSGLGFPNQSQEPSPSTSHSSYSHSQTSPATGFGLPPRAPEAFPPAGPPSAPHYRHPSTFSAGPPSSAMGGGSLFDLAHGSYEMTLDTEHGPLRVPVDVQQASHIADEKRKRNAGASARFRARRKEKEREATQTITSLEKDLREMAEERDFYANERNFFRDLASRHAQLPVRPPSPRHRRLPAPSAVSPPFQTEEGRGEPPPRNLRRRTSDYQPTAATAPPIAPISSRPPFGFGPPPAFQMPFPEIRPATGREGPAPPTSLAPRAERYDPLRQGSYDRSWNPGR